MATDRGQDPPVAADVGARFPAVRVVHVADGEREELGLRLAQHAREGIQAVNENVELACRVAGPFQRSRQVGHAQGVDGRGERLAVRGDQQHGQLAHEGSFSSPVGSPSSQQQGSEAR